MSWKPRGRSRDPQIDPFNAPDPIMPGVEDEPATEDRAAKRTENRAGEMTERADAATQEDTPRTSDERDALRWLEGAVDHVNAASKRAARSKRSDRDKRRDQPRAHQAQHPKESAPDAARKPSSRHGCAKGCAFIIVLMMIVNIGGSLFSSCARTVGDGVELIFSSITDDADYEYDYDDDDTVYDSTVYEAVRTELYEQASAAAAEILDATIAGEDRYAQVVATAFAEQFEQVIGIAPDAAGIDSLAVARSIMARLSYEYDSSFSYGDATSTGYEFECPVYFDLTYPESYSILYDLWDFIDETMPDAQESGSFSEAEQEAIAAELDRLIAAAETTELFESLRFTGTADATGETIELSDESDAWEAELAYIFGW